MSNPTPAKYAIVGSSSSGKTTLVYQVAGLLKTAGIHVETIVSGDRRLPFPAAILEETIDAQAYVILNQARLEAERSCQPGIDVVLSDRSAVDFLVYARATFPDAYRALAPYGSHFNATVNALESLVDFWAMTYRHLFYLPMRDEYDIAEQRPTLEFARRADRLLLKLLEHFNSSFTFYPAITFLPKGSPSNATEVASIIQRDQKETARLRSV